MSFVDGNGLSAADVAAVTGGNGGFGTFGGDGAWLILILLLFAAFNGNGWGGYGNGGGAIPMMMNNNATADLQRGFDQQAVMGGIGALQGSLAAMTTQNCSDAYNTLLAVQNAQNSLNQGVNSLSMGLQNCCCENRASIADLKYTVATEACADRNAISMGVRDIIQNQTQGIQTILDKLCQQEIDALKAQNANLQTQINLANLQASQNGQTAQILADNAAQTATLRQALNPTPIPAYVVQNPNGCNCGNFSGCGC